MVDQETPGVDDEKTVGMSDGSGGEGDSPLHSGPSPPQEKDSGYGDVELDFDTGLKAWLQVLGAFLLFFNSWLVGNTV